MNAEQRIRKIIEKWFITNPFLFSIWLTHQLVENKHIKSIRTGQGKIEYCSDFILSLSSNELEKILTLETMRIVLKHPYSRKKEVARLAYLASNITLREHLSIKLRIPSAKEIFQTDELNKQYFELYYDRLLQKSGANVMASNQSYQENNSKQSLDSKQTKTDDLKQSMNLQNENNISHEHPDTKQQEYQDDSSHNHHMPINTPMDNYLDESISGKENTQQWDRDEFQIEIINDKIQNANQNNSWGNLPGQFIDVILATLKPQLNYRLMLQHFRASILSNKRYLTRMKPSRRSGFFYMGSRYAFTTKLLFAIDVSGSISNEDLEKGFSIVNRMFKYGIEHIDVVQFDTRITTNIIDLKKACVNFKIIGRGGTRYDPLIQLIDDNKSYDGLIIFTDGLAPKPKKPKNNKTRILWLFNSEQHYQMMLDNVSHIGKAAYLPDNCFLKNRA